MYSRVVTYIGSPITTSLKLCQSTVELQLQQITRAIAHVVFGLFISCGLIITIQGNSNDYLFIYLLTYIYPEQNSQKKKIVKLLFTD